MMPMGLIALKPNSSRARQQWLRGVFLLCIVGCVVGGVAGAGEASANRCGKKHEVSPSELETKLKQYKSIATLEARFEQHKLLKEGGLNLKSSGRFRMTAKPGTPAEVDWTVEKPAYVRLHISEDSLLMSEKPDQPAKPVPASKEAQAKIVGHIYAWLTMDSKRISEQFNIERCGYFKLVPKANDSPINYIYMYLDKNGLVETVDLAEKSGDRISITFLDTKVTKLKDAPAK